MYTIYPADPNNKEDAWVYPEPNESNTIVGCPDIFDPVASDRLYKIMNTDLPINPADPDTGSLTWRQLWRY